MLTADGTKGLYNIVQHNGTMALHTWLMDLGDFDNNKEITDVNVDGDADRFVYPTDFALTPRRLFVPAVEGAQIRPGSCVPWSSGLRSMAD